MVAHFTLRTYDVNKVFPRRKKIGFDYSFDVTKCLQQIEMPDLPHMCAHSGMSNNLVYKPYFYL